MRKSEEWDPVSQIPAELREWGIETVLRGLVEDEQVWRQRVGDETYEQALEYWRSKAAGKELRGVT